MTKDTKIKYTNSLATTMARIKGASPQSKIVVLKAINSSGKKAFQVVFAGTVMGQYHLRKPSPHLLGCWDRTANLKAVREQLKRYLES